MKRTNITNISKSPSENFSELTQRQTAQSKSTLQNSDFVHLHNHTQYSLLDGLTRIPQLMDYIVENGMSAVAMTDHGTLSGAIEFYKEGINHEIKPIIGIETYIASRKHTDKDPAYDKNRYHLIILAMNKQGYQNLMKLSTIANLDGFYYYPRIDHQLLEKYNEGLIILSGCMGSEIGQALKNDQFDQAVDIAKWYKVVFGDRYYLEIQDHGHPQNPLPNKEQQSINDEIVKIGKKLNIESVVTSDSHYLRHEDQDAHEVLLCVGTGSFLNDEKRMSLSNFPLHVTKPQELINRWGAEHPEFITNTKVIADRCHLELDLGNILIPKYPLPKGKSEKSLLHELVWQGVARRYGGMSDEKSYKQSISSAQKLISTEVLERTKYELGVIDQMGFNGYFLIIQDFINWGKNKGIVFGPGRGSAAGSIISYSLRITELDPLKYDLLFERFLNPDRVSMPDIDIDIQDTRRDEVIQYCIDKYGSDRVANIVTFGRMFARNSVRDVARVLQVPYADADKLAKMIPPPIQGRHIPLETSLTENTDLRREYQTNPTSQKVFDLAVRLEGTIRSHGVHAAGVVIAPDELVKFAPLEMAQKGVVSTQYSMGPIEELGLLKMDFLGLSNLTIIKNALRIIKKVDGKDITVDDIPLDDSKTYELFQKGSTTGLFQFESAGMKRYLKQLKPTQFEDLIAMNALYRPGPMQWIEDFILRKHGEKSISYVHNAMEPALKNTYGIIVYQEQVMQISKDMCGFTGGQADSLRKGIGKKIPAMLAKFKNEFIEGAVNTVGADRDTMEKFWTQLEAFASYAFPKAHSSCYALIGYWTGYLKANYPSAFMAALMTSDYDNIDRLAIEITECGSLGIDVLPPDVNESFNEFAIVPGKNHIRFGLNAVKNVGSGAVDEIIRAREKLGGFKSLEEFFGNVNPRLVNKKSLESLIKSGAFDKFDKRDLLLGNMEILIAYGSKIHKDISTGQTDIFGDTVSEINKPRLALNQDVLKLKPGEELAWERELLGIYLSRHPLDDYLIFLSEKAVALNSIKTDHDGKSTQVGGAVENFREITTKNGQKMAFVGIADQFGSIELVLFPSIYQQTIGIWEKDKIVLVKGKVSSKDRSGVDTQDIKILVEDAREITLQQVSGYEPIGKKRPDIKPKKPTKTSKISENSNISSKIFVRINSADDQKQLLNIKQSIDENPGDTEVVLVIGEDSKKIIRLPSRTSEIAGLDNLESIMGKENVKLK